MLAQTYTMSDFVALSQKLQKLNGERTTLEREVKIAFDVAVLKLDPVEAARKHAAPASTVRKGRGGRRRGFKMSAEARAKIAAAQRKRWAKQKAEKKG